MENLAAKMFSMSIIKSPLTISMKHFSQKKSYSTNVRNIMKKQKLLHPYRKIHPWKSVDEFSKSLLAGVVYNQDGLVAINKPYGVSTKAPVLSDEKSNSRPSGIVNERSYSLSDALPYLATALGYPNLKFIHTPERFTSGITLLAANARIENAVDKSLRRAQGLDIVPKTYWAVTIRVPNELQGEKRLAMRMKKSPSGKSQLPIIITSWSHNAAKHREIKAFNVQFKVLSYSTDNLSSLIEIKSSTKAWHALRLFSSTVLYAPILGDNIYGSRVQNVLGKWMNISPFVDAAQVPPTLNKNLKEMLKITSASQSMIPAHLHLREIYLPMYLKKDNNLILTAPPMPEFLWTCNRLNFKHESFNTEDNNNGDDREEEEEHHPQPVRYRAVT